MHVRTPARFATRALTAVAATAILAAPALAAGEGWIQDDMAKAMAQAKAEGKDILIDFTGSDWCGWCIKLDKEVFAESQFKTEAPEDFVLVALDFPSKKAQTDEVKAHNNMWKDVYPVRGYPTIILADANGAMWAKTGYKKGGAGVYIEHLNSLRAARDTATAALARAKSLKGMDRARALDAALSVEGIAIPNTAKTMAEVIALDADGSAGLAAKYSGKLEGAKISDAAAAFSMARATSGNTEAALKNLTMLGGVARKSDSPELRAQYAMSAANAYAALEMHKEYDALVRDWTGGDLLAKPQRQRMLYGQAQSLKSRGMETEAHRAYDAAIASDPDSRMGKGLAGQREDFIAPAKADKKG